ncbi:hypothetical protein [Allosphingosinicella sp.]|uniref:hypothetical protein n=1 Tax=Allosphingosinicella sp. TaxID=2823234 RepID=UPI00378371A5
MRRRKRFGKGALVGLVIVAALVVTGASLLIPDYGDNRAEAGSVPPQAMNRIAQKNDNASIAVAAALRARSAREARIADQLQDRQDRINEAQAAH